MITTKWDNRFMTMAMMVAGWSKDPSTKVGAVIVRKNRKVVSVGYNGFPANCDDDAEIYADRNRKYKRVIHAEKNAIATANCDLDNCMLYVTLPPCSQCAAYIIQVGITTVITTTPTEDQLKRWGDDIHEAERMFEEADVEMLYLDAPVTSDEPYVPLCNDFFKGGFTFNEYADLAKSTAIYPNVGDNLAYPALGLAGEAGEVANKVKKVYRDLEPPSDEEILKEIGGVLWYCAMLSYELGVPLEQVAMQNAQILADRKKRNVLQGSGDDR